MSWVEWNWLCFVQSSIEGVGGRAWNVRRDSNMSMVMIEVAWAKVGGGQEEG